MTAEPPLTLAKITGIMALLSVAMVDAASAVPGLEWPDFNFSNMSQDNMIKFECSECGTVNYFSRKNKKILKNRLMLSKFCSNCGAHKDHKETK